MADTTLCPECQGDYVSEDGAHYCGRCESGTVEISNSEAEMKPNIACTCSEGIATCLMHTDGSHLLNGGRYDHDATRRMAEKRAQHKTTIPTLPVHREAAERAATGMPLEQTTTITVPEAWQRGALAERARIKGIIEAAPADLFMYPSARASLLAAIHGGDDANG